MIEIPIIGDTPLVKSGIWIGQETDKNARSIRFVGLPRYSDDQLVYLYLSFKDKWADVVLLEDGVFTVGALHTQYPGLVRAYIEIQSGEDVLYHTKPFYLSVGALPAIGEQIVMNSPSIMQQVTAQVDKAFTAVAEVEEKAAVVEDFSTAVETVKVNVTMVDSAAPASGSGSMDSSSGLSLSFNLPKGERGAQGVRGEKGEPGLRGEKGDPGEKGEPGKDGEKGEKGDPGSGLVLLGVVENAEALDAIEFPSPGDAYSVGTESPYDVWIYGESGEWFNHGKLQGPQGDPGEKGDPGKDGEKGEKGDPGKDGEKGEKGDPGKDGEKGEKGDPGKDGEKGEKGDPGSDANVPTSLIRQVVRTTVVLEVDGWCEASDIAELPDGVETDGKFAYKIEDSAITASTDVDFVFADAQKGKYAFTFLNPREGDVVVIADTVPDETVTLTMTVYTVTE